MLPSWLEFGLQPMRAERQRDLQAGASPLLLPDATPPAAPRRKGKAPTLHQEGRPEDGGAQALNVLDRGVLPNAETLARSEFLLPLDSNSQRLYWELLDPAWAAIGF